MLPLGDRARRTISYAYSATYTKRAAEHSTAPLLGSERVTKTPKIGRKTPKNEVAERGSAKWHCRIRACLWVAPSIHRAAEKEGVLGKWTSGDADSRKLPGAT